ncbi:hypothetical protein BGZ65_010003 [Modicella reniformis]|uniref:Uncharacterized protein n=1 Tax=Modicella reniformis TaxID=1440133 RepID=A0A9P6ISW9_9FUNG|nr:hypothetical protein BGZ65_010003 [Modicella reniformis]
MVMMSKINEYIQEASGTKISFRAIINQIQSDDVYNMYKEGVANDNFRSLFDSLKLEGFSFDDIQIDNVLLLRFDEKGVKCNAFRETISEDVQAQKKACVVFGKDISADNDDLKFYQKALLFLGSPVILAGGIVVGTIFGLYSASRFTIKSVQNVFSEE